MIKIKKQLINLGLVGAVAIPLATTVACGGSSKMGGANGHGDTFKTGLENVELISDAEVAKLKSTAPYSDASLLKDAQAIKDDTVWTNGISYHALYSSFSLIRALAEKYGYSTEKDANGLTARDRYVNANKIHFIDTDNKVSGNIALDDDVTKFYNSISNKPGANVRNMEFRPFVGDNDNMSLSGFVHLNLRSTFKMETLIERGPKDPADNSSHNLSADVDNDGQFDDAYVDSYSMWDDYKNPGNTVVQLVNTGENVYRWFNDPEMSLNHQKYPVISESVFDKDYAVYIKAMLLTFLQLYKNMDSDTLMAATSFALKDTMFFDEITYIINKNTHQQKDANGVTKDVFQIDDKQFMTFMHELNNGSMHWLAIKALYLGFDKSITSGLLVPYATQSGWQKKAAIKGLKDMDSLAGSDMNAVISGEEGIKAWAHRSTMLIPNTGSDANLYPTRDLSISTIGKNSEGLAYDLLSFRADKDVVANNAANNYQDVSNVQKELAKP